MENQMSEGAKWDILEKYFYDNFGCESDDVDKEEARLMEWFEGNFKGRDLDEISDTEIATYQ